MRYTGIFILAKSVTLLVLGCTPSSPDSKAKMDDAKKKISDAAEPGDFDRGQVRSVTAAVEVRLDGYALLRDSEVAIRKDCEGTPVNPLLLPIRYRCDGL
jgi:hypothetical protein